MNTYTKFCPNVWVASCPEMHAKGDIITVTTQHGKEHECIVFNLVGRSRSTGNYCYSVTRADGFDYQAWCKRRAERYSTASANSGKKSNEAWEKAQEGRDFLSLGEPIKVGHHSEKRHRALIERNHARMGKSIELEEKAKEQADKAAYWERRAKDINLSMPESIEFYEYKLEEAKAYHEGMKNGTIDRPHGLAMQYANKAVRDMEKNLDTAKKLWGDA